MKRRLRPLSPRSKRWLHRIGRYVVWTGALVGALVVVVYIVARLYLPVIVAERADVEAWLSEAVRHPVRVGRIEPDWDRLRPGLRVWGAEVYSADGRTASVRVGEVRVSVAVWPLLRGQLQIHRLVLIRPAVTLERHADGGIRVAGFAEAAAAPSGAGFDWLLGQSRVAVRDGELRWVDARDPRGPLLLSRLELDVRNAGERHRFTASAAFPPAVCRECAVSVDISGDPVAGPWDGEILLRAKALDVEALPLAVRERLPPGLRGRVDAQLWSGWQGGRPRLVAGEAAVSGLSYPLSAQRPPLALRQASGYVSWQSTAEGWRLDLSRLTLGLTRAPWSAGRLVLEREAAGHSLEVERIELDDVTAFLTTHQAEHSLSRDWARVRPSGALRDVKVRLRGALDAPENFALGARLERVSTAAHERLPGVRGLSGRISFDAAGGEARIDSTDFALHLPRVFRAPLNAARVAGTVRWRKTETAWRVAGSGLRVESEEGKGTGTLALEVPHDRARSPVLQLRVDFRDGNGANAARYYPAHRLPPRVLEWMESAFAGGRILGGHLVYDGPVRAWPFEEGEGRFEIRAQVRDGVYRYLSGWAPLTQVEASVAINGADALITGQGRIGNLRARDIRVEVKREADGRNRTVRVRGNVDGALAETVRVLRAVEAESAWRARAREVAAVSGSGSLELDVQVPLKSADEPSFQAAYRFEDAALRLDNGVALEAANGVVRISDAGLEASRIQARLFGGPLTLVSARSAGELYLHAEGEAQLPQLLRDRRDIAQRLSGPIGWSFAWHDRAGGPQLRARADLSRIGTRLPPPLDKVGGVIAGPLIVTTEHSNSDTLVLAVSAGSASAGKLAFTRAPDRWRFDRGRLEFGRSTAQLPQREGLELGVRAEALDVDQWLAVLEGGAGQAPVGAGALTTITAEIKQLGLLNRDWGRAYLHLVRHGAEWRAVVDGDAGAGEGKFKLGGRDPAQIRLDLAHLRLPERRSVPAGRSSADPRRLPALALHVRSFEYKARQFGELAMNAVPNRQGWHIDRLTLARPEMQLHVNGAWRQSGQRESSEFDIEWTTDDAGTTLDALGAPGQMAKGKVKVQAHLAWAGAPTQPTLASMNGKIEVTAENGRFLKFDPGAARLFGLLDLRSIGRYLTLDFSPAFGKGFTFDAIHGTLAIERGDASTSDLILKGPMLSLAIAGRVGLANEDYDLALQASPRVGSTLTLTSWGLFGPQAAAAVLALQRLFRRQIQEGTRVTYLIKGPWDNPTVTKLEKPRPERPQSQSEGLERGP